MVRLSEPLPPTRLQPRIPRDLEVICLKCLRKEPARRYAGARTGGGSRPVPGREAHSLRGPRAGPSGPGDGVDVTPRSPPPGRPGGRTARRDDDQLGSGYRRASGSPARQGQRVAGCRGRSKASIAARRLVDRSGISAAGREDHAEALLRFTHAVRLASSDPERERLNRIRVRNWERRALQPESRLSLPGFRSQQDRILTLRVPPRGPSPDRPDDRRPRHALGPGPRARTYRCPGSPNARAPPPSVRTVAGSLSAPLGVRSRSATSPPCGCWHIGTPSGGA